ncbi:MAG: tetratricopeptide repeat protein [Acidobacteria bacterium]|nr:tetratricopeptide repeat protein [Acidobacteriota bacterium]
MAIDRVKVRKEAEKFQASGRLDKAIDCYRMLVDDDPKNLGLMNTLGDLMAQANRPAEAADVFRRLAIAYERDGFAPKATAILKKAVRSAPDDMDLMQRLADLYRQTGMIRDAVATHLQVAEAFQKKGLVKRALEEFGKVVDLDPKNLKNKIKLADLFNKEGMKDQAAAIYLEVAESLGMEGKAAEALQIVDRAKAMTTAPQLFLSQSRLAVMANDYAGASNALREGLKANARSVELLEALAEIEIRGNNPDRALEALAQVPQLPEKDLALCERALKQMVGAGRGEEGLRLFSPLGRELARRGMSDTVTRAVASAIKEKPFVEAWMYLAEVAQQGGNANEQIYALQNAHQLASQAGDSRAMELAKEQLASLGATPDDQPLSKPASFQTSAGFQALGSAGASGEHTRGGETEIDPLKRLKVDQFVKQGEAFARSGSNDRAVEAYKQALTLDPANFTLIEAICTIHRQAGLLTRVQQQYLQSAQTVHGLGKPKEATFLLDKAEQLFPGSTRIHRRTMGLPDYNAQAPAMQPVAPASPAAPPAPAAIALPAAAPLTYSPDAIIPLDLPDLDQAPAVGTPAGGFNPSAPTPAPFALPPAMDAIPMPPPAMETMPLPPMVEPLGADDFTMPPTPTVPSPMPPAMPPTAPVVALPDLPPLPPAAMAPTVPAPFTPEPFTPEPFTPEPAMAMAAGVEIPEKLQDLLSDIDFQLDYGSPEEAKAEIDAALEQFPGHPELMGRAAKAEEKLQKLGHGSKAQALGEEDFANSFFDLTDVLGSALEDSGEGEEMHDATKVVDKVQSVDELFDAFRMGVEEQVKGDDYDTHYNLGIAYKEMMLLDPAIDEFKKVLRDPERTLECCSMLSICEQARGNMDEAIAWLQKGIQAPGFPPEDSIGLRYDLGDMYLQMGDRSAALQEFRAVHDLDPDYRDVAAKVQ